MLRVRPEADATTDVPCVYYQVNTIAAYPLHSLGEKLFTTVSREMTFLVI